MSCAEAAVPDSMDGDLRDARDRPQVPGAGRQGPDRCLPLQQVPMLALDVQVKDSNATVGHEANQAADPTLGRTTRMGGPPSHLTCRWH